MFNKLILCLMCLIATITSPANAKDNWDKWKLYENQYFRIYSDAPQKTVITILGELEKFRVLSKVAFPSKVPASAPKSIIILFKSRSKFKEFWYRQNLTGFMTFIKGTPFIVMPVSPRGVEAETTIKHEYVHVVQGYAQHRNPVWVREGLAEMFSTASYHQNVAFVGAADKRRWRYLSREYDYDKLVAEGFDSLKRIRGADAYAQYWLLTNYSLTHNDGVYISNFGKYLKLYRAGEESLVAFQQAYGKTPNALAKEALQNYGNRRYSYKKLFYILDYSQLDLVPSISLPETGKVAKLMSHLRIKVEQIRRDSQTK